MTFLTLHHITKHFGKTTAVDDIHLTVEKGEFLTLLGPSGCGKTTLLRMVAGFESPDAGAILLDQEDITRQNANKRPMGMVFQSYALFPHLTAEQNIAFGMRIKRMSSVDIKRRCGELLDVVNLGNMGNRFPHQLSGGQQQRIALARALAIEPKVLLLDEPLSALDAKVRVSLRNEIRRIQQQLKMTAIYVTHDQEEALAISDRIAIMSNGKIQQLDTPEAIYHNPSTQFTATFVGASNQFKGIITSDGQFQSGALTLRIPSSTQLQSGDHVIVVVRPESLSLQHQTDTENGQGSIMNSVTGVIELRTFMGPYTRFHVQVNEANTTLIADIPSQHAPKYTIGQNATLTFLPEVCQIVQG